MKSYSPSVQPSTVAPTYDGNGNVTAYVDLGSNQIVARYDYDAFGLAVIRDEGAWAGRLPYQFSTKYTDAETGLLYYGFRYYSAELGRWLSRDPIGERGGLNLYGMVGNNAVNTIDWLGLLELCVQSPYSDMDNSQMWDQLYNNEAISHENMPNIELPGHTLGYGGETTQDATVNIPDPIKDGACWNIPGGSLDHIVIKLAMNNNPERPKTFYDDYWGTAGHELQHIRAFLSRLQKIADDAAEWKDSKFATEQEAKDAIKEYKERLEKAIKDALGDESMHDPGGGHGTPPRGKPVPFGPRQPWQK